MMRPFRNGKGSYDLIIPKFQKLAESRNQEKYYVRGTFTREQSGLFQRCPASGRSGIQADLCRAGSSAADEKTTAIREEDIPQICEEYDKLAKEMVRREKEGRGFNFFHFMIDLTGGPCVATSDCPDADQEPNTWP